MRSIRGSVLLGIVLSVLVFSGKAATAQTAVVDAIGREEVSGSVELAITDNGPVIGYNGNEGDIYLAVLETASGAWESSRVDAINEGYIDALTNMNYNDLVLGYLLNGRLYSMTVCDNLEFGVPVEITEGAQGASIVDFDTSEDNYLYSVFHRHDSYWDYNLAVSTDGGNSYRVRNAITANWDSSSTGYSGNIVAKHAGLYTVYQDNNDGYAVKFGYSPDQGNSWYFTSFPSSTGVLNLAVDPRNSWTAYIALINGEGLTVIKSDRANSMEDANLHVAYHDPNVKFSRNNVRYADIGVTESGEVVLIYLDSDDRYKVTTSADGGQIWSLPQVVGRAKSGIYWWQPDLEIDGDTVWFAYYDASGDVAVYTNSRLQMADDSAAVVSYKPDEDGYILLPTLADPFSFPMDDGVVIMFTCEESGSYSITIKGAPESSTYFALYDVYAESDTAVAENYQGGELLTRVSDAELQEGTTYFLLMALFDESDAGEELKVAFSLQDGVPEPDVEVEPYSGIELPPDTGSVGHLQVDYEKTIGWGDNAQTWSDEVGAVVAITLPPGGQYYTIWGTDTYTDDSSIGTAAVHAGLISFAEGGTVYIEMTGEQSEFPGTMRNGLTSNNYGYWGGSFRFVN